MSATDHYFQVKRGRPKKKDQEVFLNLKNQSKNCNLLLNESYIVSQKQYLKENYFPTIHSMVSRIPTILKFPIEVKMLALLNLLEENTKKFMMSEIEVATFSVYLGEVDWNLRVFSPQFIIASCFFLAKKHLETNQAHLTVLENDLKAQFKNFSVNYVEITKNCKFDIKKVNKKYHILKKCIPESNINYNYYVDDIIRVSPPYNMSLKKVKKTEIPTQKQESFSNFDKSSFTDETFEMLTYEKLLPFHDYEDYYNNKDSPRSFPSPFCDSNLSDSEFFENSSIDKTLNSLK
jgi:hypothetical protein